MTPIPYPSKSAIAKAATFMAATEAVAAAKISLTVFGPNLRDQSKGQFVVHTRCCGDCVKLHKRGENSFVGVFSSEEELARDLYADQINEGLTVADALQEIHFAPCVKFAK